MPTCQDCGTEFEGEDWKTLCKLCYKVSKGYITKERSDTIRAKENEFWELIGDRDIEGYIEDAYGCYKPFSLYKIPEGYKQKRTYQWTPNWGTWWSITTWKCKGLPDIFEVHIEAMPLDYDFCTIDRSIFPEKSNKVYYGGAYCGWGYSCH